MGFPEPLSIAPVTGEEVENHLEKDGISFIFETRSVSSVIRFIYTPIDGTLADLELEINNADPILPAEQGGITIEMGGQKWSAASEHIERRLVSCEQVGNTVEARWQWKCGEELADFLYRLAIKGKTLVVELEGGNGKATGIDLGQLTGAIHPRLIAVPYFNLGEGAPHLLCTAGVFVSSLLDWRTSHSSALGAPDTAQARPQLRLNSGCLYQPKTDGKRLPLHERWLLTVSRQFEEVLPAVPPPSQSPLCEPLKTLVWYNVPALAPTGESYVEIYEQLRIFKQWGLQDVLVNHPDETWHDGDGNATLTLDAAPQKGGDDALSEYLEAIEDLGYSFSLCTNLAEIATVNPHWSPDIAALQPDAKPAPASPGAYRLKPAKAASLATEHIQKIAKKFHNPMLYLTRHTALPPWCFVDFDCQTDGAGTFREALRKQREILAAAVAGQSGPVIGEGGNHWFYPGLLHGHLARQPGAAVGHRPLLVDFALRHLHPVQLDAGLGTIEQFFGAEAEAGEKSSRSPLLDRFLALTVAFGHAGVLPDPAAWGLAAAAKTYYLLRPLQPCYLGIPVAAIRYHHAGNLLETSEALVSGAAEYSQVKITYQNGLQVFVNDGREDTWMVDHQEQSYRLPPGSFLAHLPEGPLVYSADTGSGRIDFARCSQYLYCDTRGTQQQIGPLTLAGAALLLQNQWEIDILPIECQGEIEVDLTGFWTDRRLPPLRVLAFKPDEQEPETLKAAIHNQRILFPLQEGVYKYRITLPEWMVEPGR